MPAGRSLRRPQDNPFRVDRVTGLPFLGIDVAGLAAKFLAAGGRGAIVGREGAGKSTLLRAIAAAVRNAGKSVNDFRLAASAQRAVCATEVTRTTDSARGNIVFFDGYEQLSPLQRWKLRRRGPLLVTAHQPTRLPTLITLTPSPATLERVLAELIGPPSIETRRLAHRRFVDRRGDVRLTLFDLYDAWAEGRIDGPACSAEPNAAISFAELNRGETDYGAHAHYP